jgi:hypothetical protein
MIGSYRNKLLGSQFKHFLTIHTTFFINIFCGSDLCKMRSEDSSRNRAVQDFVSMRKVQDQVFARVRMVQEQDFARILVVQD